MIVPCVPALPYAWYPRPAVPAAMPADYGAQQPAAGMGQAAIPPSKEAIILSAPAIVGATLQTASALGSRWATAAIPVVGPIVAGVTVGLSLLFARRGPRQKLATTQIVDAVEPKLKQNLEGYFSGPRTRASQAQALANFDAAWEYIVQNCGAPEMGEPGKRCIRDRQQGACTWRASCVRRIDGVCVEWQLDPNGECWNWFVGYRDPIANDPLVREDGGRVVAAGSIEQALTDGPAGAESGSVLLAGIAALIMLVLGYRIVSST